MIWRTQFAELIDDLSVSVIMLDEDLRVRWSNEATARILGEPEAQPGHAYCEVFPALGSQAVLNGLALVGVDREPRTVSYRSVAPSDRPVSSLATRIEWRDDGFLLLTRDEAQVLSAELEPAFSSANEPDDIFWQLNVETMRLSWSEKAPEFFGIAIHAEDGLTFTWDKWADLIHEEDRAEFLDIVHRDLPNPYPGWTTSFRVKAAGGIYVPVAVHTMTVMKGAEEPTRILGKMVNLAEKRRLDEQLRRQRTEIVQVSGENAMGVMASTLAHEINQPLAAVSNYLGGLERILNGEDVDYALAMDALAHARANIERSGAIIRQIRLAVERQERSAGLVELRGVVNDAAAFVFAEPRRAKGVKFTMDVPVNLVVRGDYVQLQQVIVRLLRNGVEEAQKTDRKELRVVGSVKDGHARLEIIDSGNGVAADKRIFDPFMASSDEAFGMGLSVTRTIVEAHDGRIWPEESEGGSKFVVELPVAA